MRHADPVRFRTRDRFDQSPAINRPFNRLELTNGVVLKRLLNLKTVLRCAGCHMAHRDICAMHCKCAVFILKPRNSQIKDSQLRIAMKW